MIQHLSPSSLAMFLRCNKQWAYRYLDGIKIPPKGVMVLGSCYHEGIAAGFRHKMNTGEEPTLELVQDAFDSKWANIRAHNVLMDEEEALPFDAIDWEADPGELKDTGMKLLSIYEKAVAPKLNPLIVEETQTLDVDGVRIVMIPDLVTENKIIDHKVKARRFSEDDLKQDLQATCYYLKNRKPFEFHLALRQVKPCIEIQSAPRNGTDTKFFTELVSKVWEAIQGGIFYPRPMGYQCTPKWCGYWDICRKP
jgi:hypothetical protein